MLTENEFFPKSFETLKLEPEKVTAIENFRLEFEKSLETKLDDLPLPISEKEWKWMDNACIIRYLKATKWDILAAVKRVHNTLAWRRAYKPDEIKPEDIVEEAITGKEFIKGVGKCGRPLLYLIPARENSKDYDRMMKFVVFNIETCIKLMKDGVESVIIVLDYKNVSVLNAPPLSISKKFLSIVGDHYPEIQAKWLFNLVTASKIHMISSSKSTKKDQPAEGMGGSVSDICAFIDRDQLLTEYGGNLEWQWDFEEYWNDIKKIY